MYTDPEDAGTSWSSSQGASLWCSQPNPVKSSQMWFKVPTFSQNLQISSYTESLQNQVYLVPGVNFFRQIQCNCLSWYADSVSDCLLGSVSTWQIPPKS